MTSVFKRFLVDGVLLFLLGIYVFAGRDAVPFHGDESTIIRLSKDFEYIFDREDGRRGFFDYEAPDDEKTRERSQRLLVGAIGPLAMGLARFIAGLDESQLNDFWEWSDPEGALENFDNWAWNIEQGNMPSDRLLQVARTPSVIFTIFSFVVLFSIVWTITRSRLAAWVATLAYITTPAILLNGRRAMQEGAMLFFTTLAIYFALLIIRETQQPETRWSRLILGYTLLALVNGFAEASKHISAIVIAAAYFAILVAILLATRRIPTGRRASWITKQVSLAAGSGFLSVAFFHIFTPMWWKLWYVIILWMAIGVLLISFGLTHKPWLGWTLRVLGAVGLIFVSVARPEAWTRLPESIASTITKRTILIQHQTSLIGKFSSPGERIATLANELYFAGNQYFEDPQWFNFKDLNRQINAYDSTRLDGRRGGYAWGALLIALSALGLWALFTSRHNPDMILVLCWFVIPAILLLLTNPLPIQRYYILLHAPMGAIVGIGAGQLQTIVRKHAGS